MPSRRVVLRRATGAAVLGVLGSCAGCRADPTGSGSGTGGAGTGDAAEAEEISRFDTRLGPVRLITPAGRSSSWRPLVARAADQVGAIWGRGPLVVVRVCDDATFAGLEPDLDAGTAAVTTTAGVFVAPALARGVTAEGRVVVLAHELTHARLGHAGHDRTQWWLKEGIAEWSAAALARHVTDAERWPQLSHALCAGRVSSSPPPDSEVGAELGYEWAHAYVTYLVEVVGREGVMAAVRDRPADATAWARTASSRAMPFVAWLRPRIGSTC